MNRAPNVFYITTMFSWDQIFLSAKKSCRKSITFCNATLFSFSLKNPVHHISLHFHFFSHITMITVEEILICSAKQSRISQTRSWERESLEKNAFLLKRKCCLLALKSGKINHEKFKFNWLWSICLLFIFWHINSAFPPIIYNYIYSQQ